jgi:GNAT superfamily N-acetyltransferase
MQTWTRPPVEVSTDDKRLDIDLMHHFLARTYWSPGIPRDILERALANSLNFGAYADGQQLGFARVVTDRATFAYLCDVFVLEEWRGRGVSKFIMECVMSHPDLQNLRRLMLATADAHGLYRQFGFEAIARSERMMEIVTPDVYQRLGSADPRT